MIPVKLFQRLTDYEEAYLDDPTPQNYVRVTNFQDKINWPYKASQEQLDYWNNINRDAGSSKYCPKCKGELDIDSNSKQCHKCKQLWPITFSVPEVK